MSAPILYLNASEAAAQLGVSAKALRLYEERGLIMPVRSAAGWRAYGPDEMARAAQIVGLRGLGLSLAQVARVLDGKADGLEAALAAHEVSLDAQVRQLSATIGKVRGLRADLARGAALSAEDVMGAPGAASIAFDLPWPWGGERFALRMDGALTHIVGPLGSGKTRLLYAIAETLSARFIDMERTDIAPPQEEGHRARVEASMAWLAEEGVAETDMLRRLIVAIEAESEAPLVIDMIEQGLDEAAQSALIALLRRRGPAARPLYFTTRSSAILDLADVTAEEALILCPANHAPPTYVAAHPGAPGYEAIGTCLGPADVRARTEGMRAVMPAA